MSKARDSWDGQQPISPTNLNQFKSVINEEGRECTYCGVFKPWGDFYKASKSYTGHQACCKVCKNSKHPKPLDRKKERYSAKLHKQKLKKSDPFFWRARNLRTSLKTRAKKHGLDYSPTAEEIKNWLLSQTPLTCYYSGEPVDLFKMHVDHKIPLNRGGTNHFENLCVAEHKMNSAKGQMTDKEFSELLALISTWEDGGKYLLIRLRQGFMGSR